MDPTVDYYRVLGVPATAEHAAIRAAYRSRIQKLHPDRYAGDAAEAERRTSELNVAFGIIGNAGSRARYDRLRADTVAVRAKQPPAPWWRNARTISILIMSISIVLSVVLIPTTPVQRATLPAKPEPIVFTPPAAQPSTSPAVDPVVAQLMAAQYGKLYDAQMKCWRHEATGLSRTHYCVKVAQVQTISAHDGERLYLLADGYPYDPQTLTPNGTHDDGGLVGAFLYQRSPFGDWELRAGRANFEFGSAGRSGADRAELRAVGVNDHLAWIFVVGGASQDATTRRVAILAPAGREFTNLSNDP